MSWLAETHGRKFELLRHFLASMFDSDPARWRSSCGDALHAAAAGRDAAVEIKETPRGCAYRRGLDTAGPFQAAVMGSELGVLTLVFAITGLIALAQWQALFPTMARPYLWRWREP